MPGHNDMIRLGKYWFIPVLLLGVYAWQAHHFSSLPVPGPVHDQIPSAAPVASTPHAAKEWKSRMFQNSSQPPSVVDVIPVVVDGASTAEDPRAQLAAMAGTIAQMGTNELISRLQNLTPDELSGDLGRLLIRRWAEMDPIAAGAWVTQLADTQGRRELSVALALAWSGNDLAAAKAWAQSLPADDIQIEVLRQLGYEMARDNPVEALALAGKLPLDDGTKGLVLTALKQWVSQDATAAVDWALALSVGQLRAEALADAATVMAEHDGERAAELAASQIPAGAEQDRAAIAIVQRWARTDPEATRDWIKMFPQPLRATAEQTFADISTRLSTQ